MRTAPFRTVDLHSLLPFGGSTLLVPDNPPPSLLATWRLQESERAGIDSVIGMVRFNVDVYLNSPKIVCDKEDERPIVVPYSEAGICNYFTPAFLSVMAYQSASSEAKIQSRNQSLSSQGWNSRRTLCRCNRCRGKGDSLSGKRRACAEWR